MNYNITLCHLCQKAMTFRQLRECVYWLPDMDESELLWARYEGFEHKMAHRHCWRQLKEKRRELIRICSFKGQEPRSMGGKV